MTTLETLIKSRGILAECYIKRYQDDAHGGHCALGSIAKAKNIQTDKYGGTPRFVLPTPAENMPEVEILNKKARQLFPIVISNANSYDLPIVAVNNNTDKESTLRVFDAAIEELQVMEDLMNPPVKEVVKVVEKVYLAA